MYVYIGFLYSLIFLVYLFCLLGLNIEWFLKKVLWSMTFQLDVILIQSSKEVHFSLFCSVNLPEKETSSHQWRKHFIIPTNLYSEHRILHKDQISSTCCVNHIKLKRKGHWSLHLIVLTWWCYIVHHH